MIKYKYNKIEEIKQTKKYKELYSAYINNPTSYTAFNVCSYYLDEMEHCKEFYDKLNDWSNCFVSKLVDVKNIALGDKAEYVGDFAPQKYLFEQYKI